MVERRWQCVLASFDGEEPLISHWFYKGLPLTVRFCSCRQGPDGLHSGVAEVSFRKTKEIQRFPWGTKGGFNDAQEGINSRLGFQWRGPTISLMFYKGFRLTVRFPGRLFFLARAKVIILQWF